MSKNIVIGAGFSAIFTKMLIGKDTTIIGAIDDKIKKKNFFLRRKSIEVNKFFSKKALSIGTLKFDLKHGKFHDRLIQGGNSNIWGGHINLKKFPKKIFKIFKLLNINFRPLSYNFTGTISNDINIYQIQNNNNKIYSAQKTPFKIQEGYIYKVYVKKNLLYIELINKKLVKKKLRVKNLFLCIGTVQLIDLLFRSNFLKEGDVIEFSEFKYSLKFKFFNSELSNKEVIIRYHFSRALGHLLGIQSYTKYLKFFKFVPFYVDQNFYKEKKVYKLSIKNNIVKEKNSQNFLKLKFGESIHYCNMKINGVDINSYLSKIHKNIKGIGTSFIDQQTPGPISNDIILNILKKIQTKKI